MILEKMNLEEVINPHYAFPIVGVILCALLVFAFGFKTPVQPPSFDFEENHRKVTSKKKQKSKDKQPKVVQNGSTPQTKGIANAHPQSSDDEPPVAKIKPTNTSTTAEKPTNKTETKTKVKKSASAAQQQPSQPEVKQAASTEDTSGAGQWVQLLSKKDRKNRKKEEPTEKISVDTKRRGQGSPTKIKSQKAAKEVPSTTTATTTTVAATEPIAEDKATTEETIFETQTKPEVTAKEQREPNKKKGGKTEPKPLAEETQPIAVTNDQGKGKKDKKEKKVEEIKAKIAIQSSPKPVETINIAPPPVQDKTSTDTEEEKPEDNVGNVAFDELGDMWQDSKPQKKKKKARRE